MSPTAIPGNLILQSPTASKLILVNDQRNPAGDAQITYGITSTGGVFNLRSTGTVDYEVEWGDGTVERSTSNVLAHTYAAGSYGLKIRTAQQYRPYFNNSTDEDQITSVALVSDLDVGTNLASAWFGANNMTRFNAAFGVTTGVTDFSGAWRACSGLTSFPLIDVSSGGTFASSWRDCFGLTSFPLIDTSSGNNFANTWNSCSGLTSFPLIDTSSGTTFDSTWRNCSSLTSFPLIDASSGTNFYGAWRDCSSLTSFPTLDVSSGTNFRNTWYGCSGLTSFPLIDTSSGRSFYGTWETCTDLTSFPLIDVSSGTTFQQAWLNCNGLTTFPANFFDSWTGTPVNSCFVNTWLNCSSLTATSVENILNSIDTSGQSAPGTGPDITIDYNASTGAPNISTAVSNLKGRGWTITLNGVAQ